MLDTTTVVDPTLDRDDKARGHEPDHRQSPHGDSTSSLTPPDETRMTEICVMSSVAEMHMAGLKTGVRSASALNKNSMKKGTMTTMVLIMTKLTDSVLLKEGTMQEESRLFPTT
jgi:hypothetical protein